MEINRVVSLGESVYAGLYRSSRARRIILYVDAEGVRVAVPPGVSFRKAEKFARSRRGWIERKLSRIDHMESEQRRNLNTDRINLRRASGELRSMTRILADRYGFEYGMIRIKRQKTRWGSCSEKKNINLNVFLYILPRALRRYVILHELLHTKIRNHGEKYWLELEKIIPSARQLDMELKNYSPGLLEKTVMVYDG